eukprot:7504851-Alexandrium_andersonii.AAC.1
MEGADLAQDLGHCGWHQGGQATILLVIQPRAANHSPRELAAKTVSRPGPGSPFIWWAYPCMS